MRTEDVNILESNLPRWKEIAGEVEDIGLLSGGGVESYILQKLYPNAWITELSIDDWNLTNKGDKNFDLIVACNVFMYSRDPESWFKNVLERCKYFWIQDLIRSWRCDASECADGPGGDGDCMRFTMPPNYLARVDHAYDLTRLSDRIVEFDPYKTQGRPDKDALSFIMFLKGDLCPSEKS